MAAKIGMAAPEAPSTSTTLPVVPAGATVHAAPNIQNGVNGLKLLYADIELYRQANDGKYPHSLRSVFVTGAEGASLLAKERLGEVWPRAGVSLF